MNQKQKFSIKQLWDSFYKNTFPTKTDNLQQIITKLIFIFSIVLLVSFFIFVCVYFTASNREQHLLSQSKIIFNEYSKKSNNKKALNYFKSQNSDFKGWITIKNTDLSAPIYQTNDNKFYKTHNHQKSANRIGCLYFDYRDEFSKKDQNLIIYGKNEQQLFSCLQNYKSIYYYKDNPFINLSTLNSTDKYVIFATFIINSDKDDDNGHLFNYKKSSFKSETEFTNWIENINNRSLYSNGIPLNIDDEFLTLVTDSNEFEGAKLVVMACKVTEDKYIKINPKINKKPIFPQAYYDSKNIQNPFIKEDIYVS